MPTKRPSARIFDRLIFNRDVILCDETGKGWLSLPAQNISSNGLALKTKIPFPRGMRLFLRIPLEEGYEPFCVHAEVLRWVYQKETAPPRLIGIGVRFVHLVAVDVVRLEQFLRLA